MKNSCDYHPLHPARWQCQQCHSFYCTSCMPEFGPRCPDCTHSLRNLGSSNEIEPFWNRVSTFFKYPFKGHSLIVVIFSTIILSRTEETLSSGLIALAVMSFYILYSFSVLKHMAKGELTPPHLITAFDGNIKIFLKSILWMAGLCFIGASGFLVAQWLGWITVMFVLFLFPASAIIYVHESSVVNAINPARLLGFFLKTHMGYLILFVHLVLIIMVMTAIQDWIINKELPSVVYSAVVSFFSVYSSIVIYALCGYFLLQYQRELGLFAIVEGSEIIEADALCKVKLRLKKGDYDGALIELKKLRETNKSPELEYYLWDLLLQLKRFEELSFNADNILRRFLSTKTFAEIKPFVVYLLNTGANKITELPVRMQLAKALHNQHLNKWAYFLLKDVHKTHRTDPDLVKSLTLLADVALAMNQDNYANKILSFAYGIANESEKDAITAKRAVFA